MISAKVIADSVYNDKRITTLQLVMPRFTLSQFNKHRAFSSNAASSRAIPTAKLIEQVRKDCVKPVYWGENQAGMVADNELKGWKKGVCEEIWGIAAHNAADTAQQLLEMGVHKQIANRVLEPFMWAHVVVTATEWDNFFKLRLEHDSQPEMQELARCMKEAMDNSEPVQRRVHFPYITKKDWDVYQYLTVDDPSAGFKDADYCELAKISAARCARVSYLNHDQSEPDLVKDLTLAKRLHDAFHLSVFEHQAVAYANPTMQSGNFKGWLQHRKEIENG